MEQNLLQNQLQEFFQKNFQEYFKEVVSLGNLHLLDHSNASEILAIFFSLDAQGFNAFWQSETLQKLCKIYCKTLSFKGIMQVQYTLLLNLQNAFLDDPKATQELLKNTLLNLEILKRENLTKSVLLDSIFSYFNLLIHTKITSNSIQKTQKNDSNFIASKALLEDFLEEGLKLLKAQQIAIKERIEQHFTHLLSNLEPLELLLQKAQNQHFSIGVTGVLSSGKSTLLNALLGQQILGTSTIPETASLTLLEYAKTPSARVSFWNTKEWQDLKSIIEETSLNALFSNAEFSKSFEAFVKDSTQSLDVSIEELPKYTSANHSSKICNLTKETTLFTPLEFLQNHVEIVDTPGLDDPIIQREEITKDYLAKCDLLIHAMNASQSATQIDRDFIVEALQSANLCRILIVLTHADLLEKSELEAALAYTKESIKESIKSSLQNTQNKEIELLFERLDFIAIASYPALICQINPSQAEELGYNLKDSNFEALIEYLNQTLLGNNSTKAKDIVYLCAQGFKRVHQSILDSIMLEQRLLFAKEDEIKMQITKAKEKRESSQSALESAKNALNSVIMQLKDFSTTLQNQLHQKLLNAQNILSERIFADIIYDYEKGKTPSKQRLEYLLDLGLKDLLSEILRFSKQSLEKKISQLSLQFQTYLEDIALNNEGAALQNQNPNLCFNPTLLQKTKLKILTRVLKSAKTFSKNKKDSLKTSLEEDFKEGFLEFISALIDQSNAIEDQHIAYFTDLLDSIKTQLELDLQSKENILQNALKNLHANASQKEQKENTLREILELLKAQIKECEMLQYYATRGDNA